MKPAKALDVDIDMNLMQDNITIIRPITSQKLYRGSAQILGLEMAKKKIIITSSEGDVLVFGSNHIEFQKKTEKIGADLIPQISQVATDDIKRELGPGNDQ